jgi:uncharacterized protein (TIGR03067 family)
MTAHSIALCVMTIMACVQDRGGAGQERADPTQIRGNWQVVSAIYPRSGALPEAEVQKISMEVTEDTLTYKKSGRIYGTPLSYKEIAQTSPRRIELTETGGPRAGAKRQAIYEREGDSLRLAVAQPGDPAPKGFDADGRSFIYVMKRVTKEVDGQ